MNVSLHKVCSQALLTVYVIRNNKTRAARSYLALITLTSSHTTHHLS